MMGPGGLLAGYRTAVYWYQQARASDRVNWTKGATPPNRLTGKPEHAATQTNGVYRKLNRKQQTGRTVDQEVSGPG